MTKSTRGVRAGIVRSRLHGKQSASRLTALARSAVPRKAMCVRVVCSQISEKASMRFIPSRIDPTGRGLRASSRRTRLGSFLVDDHRAAYGHATWLEPLARASSAGVQSRATQIRAIRLRLALY